MSNEKREIWWECIFSFLGMQLLCTVCLGVGIYLSVAKLVQIQRDCQMLFLGIVVVFTVFSCYALHVIKEIISKYFEYLKGCEDRNKEEYKFSRQLLELLSKRNSSNKSSDKNCKLSVECYLSNED